MLILGVTGSIATGKSSAMQCLKALGAVCFSADEASRVILDGNVEIQKKIVSLFGKAITNSTGAIDRKLLGKLIFSDQTFRRQLEALLHPPILNLLTAQIDAVKADLPASPAIAVEIPLLFESHCEYLVEQILVVAASEKIQIHRLVSSTRLTEHEALDRIHSQWPIEVKQALANHTIFNEGTKDELCFVIKDIWNILGLN